MKRKLFALVFLFAIQLSAQNALNFDGLNDYVSSTFSGITGGSARTVEAWIRTTANSDSSQVVIVDWGIAATSSRFTFNLLTGGALRLEVQGNGFTGITAVNDGAWHHVAAVYNPTATNPVLLYVDGTLDASGSLTVPVNTVAGNFQIGMRVDGVKNFKGSIDEVRVWNVARTQSQLAADMNSEYCTIPPNLVAYYRLNEGTAGGNNGGATTAFEDISSANGTLNNFSLNGATSNWVTGSGITPGGPNFIQVTANGCNDYMGPGGVIYDSSGVYLDTLQNIYGCDSVIETTLTVQQLDVTVTTTSSTLKANQINATYRWLDCNDNYKLVVGGTNQTLTPPNPNGSYAVSVNYAGCTDTSDCYSLDGVGLFENKISPLEIYPNPTSGKFSIFHPVAGKPEISVFTAAGQLVVELNGLGANETPIDLSSNPKGIYFIKLEVDGETFVERLILE